MRKRQRETCIEEGGREGGDGETRKGEYCHRKSSYR